MLPYRLAQAVGNRGSVTAVRCISQDTELERNVVIKGCATTWTTKPHARALFANQRVTVFDYGVDREQQFIVMAAMRRSAATADIDAMARVSTRLLLLAICQWTSA